MEELRVAGQRLIDLARPLLDAGDTAALADALLQGWTCDCLALLLDQADPLVAQTAAACLGLVGDASILPRLCRLLHHADDAVVQTAEDAFWAISFRAANPAENRALGRIAESIRTGQPENAVALLRPFVRADRPLPEVFHQRGQAYYFDGDYVQALRDAETAVRHCPHHFAAHALRANCLAALHRDAEALEAYRRVLQIHPRFYRAKEAVECLRRRLAQCSS